MSVTINQKILLLNERVLFKERQLVEISGAFPIRIRANSAAAPGIGFVSVGGIFELSIDGMSVSNFDQVTSGSGSLNGVAFEYIVRTVYVAALGADKIYEVSMTVNAV
ncbi:hypothetical protein ABIC16_003708 [Sphingomonas sp. PvP055]|uniref:hypothetical protein n=1 Tax=Sphingomonas sp. PvP055 TaxID=3156391 RepID=UPI0033964330